MKTNQGLSLAALLAASFIASTAHAQGVLPAGASDEVIFVPTAYTAIIPENGPAAGEFLPAFAPAPNVPDQIVYLTEPGISTAVVISDAIWVQSGFLYFESDSEVNGVDGLATAPPAGLPVTATIPETGLLQDIGIILKEPTGGPAFAPGALLVGSDVETTPEPSTLALLGIGSVACLKMFRRRLI